MPQTCFPQTIPCLSKWLLHSGSDFKPWTLLWLLFFFYPSHPICQKVLLFPSSKQICSPATFHSLYCYHPDPSNGHFLPGWLQYLPYWSPCIISVPLLLTLNPLLEYQSDYLTALLRGSNGFCHTQVGFSRNRCWGGVWSARSLLRSVSVKGRGGAGVGKVREEGGRSWTVTRPCSTLWKFLELELPERVFCEMAFLRCLMWPALGGAWPQARCLRQLSWASKELSVGRQSSSIAGPSLKGNLGGASLIYYCVPCHKESASK